MVAVLGTCIATSAWAASIDVTLRDSAGAPVQRAVVLARPAGASADSVPASKDGPRVEQEFQEFRPAVLPVRAGTTVEFPNFDRMRHHVYSFSEAKRFEIRLYSGEQVPEVLFDSVGAVVIGCNIHDWMEAYIYVTDAPWFAVTDETGRVVLDDMPQGSYSISVWHPSLNEESEVASLVMTGADIDAALDRVIEPLSQDRPDNTLFSMFEHAER